MPQDELGPQRDAGVLWIAYVLGLIQALLNQFLYHPFSWVLSKAGRHWEADVRPTPPPWFVAITQQRRPSKIPTRQPWLYFNYWYTGGWLLLAFGGYVATAHVVDAWFPPVVVGVVSWRIAEILVLHLKMLVDRTHALLLAPERNLVFLAVDGLVVVTGIAAMLIESRSEGPSLTAWVDGFSILTLNGRPALYAGGWANAAALVGTVAGLVLIAAALAVLLGLIQRKFRPGFGSYTGPTRIARPHPMDD